MALSDRNTQTVFSEAVELACAKSVPSQINLFRTLNALVEKELVKNYPSDSARLIEHLFAQRTEKLHRGININIVMDNLIQYSTCKPVLIRICNRMAELGYEKAMEWLERVNKLPDIENQDQGD